MIHHNYHMPLTIGVILLFFLTGCEAPNDDARFEEEMREQFQESMEIWNEGNLDLVDEFYSPDAVRHSVDIEESIVGAEALKEYITGLRTAYPDFNVQGEIVVASDGWSVSQWTVTGTNTGPSEDMPPTGRSIQISGATISQVVDGKTVEEWVYYNNAAILEQLGFTFLPPEIEE